MIFAGFSLVKLLGGFNLLNGEKLGKLLFQVAIIAVCLGIFYKTFVLPTSKTIIQKPQNVIINQDKPEKLFLGAKCFGLNLGFSLR